MWVGGLVQVSCHGHFMCLLEMAFSRVYCIDLGFFPLFLHTKLIGGGGGERGSIKSRGQYFCEFRVISSPVMIIQVLTCMQYISLQSVDQASCYSIDFFQHYFLNGR